MAYDVELAERIRGLLSDRGDVAEKKLFGGCAFLIGGNLAVSASSEGGVLLRVDPDRVEELVAGGTATVAVMRGRPMRGWMRVAPEHLRTERQLTKWVSLAASYAASLPSK